MKNLFRSKNFYLMLLMDIVLLSISLALSALLRFEFKLTPDLLSKFITVLPIVLAVKISIFFLMGLYRGMWRYTSVSDMVDIFKATFMSSVTVIIAILLIFSFRGYSRAVFLIDGLLTFLFISGSRVGIRLLLVKSSGFGPDLVKKIITKSKGSKPYKRLIIIGAGDAGEKMLREISDNPRLDYLPVGFLDDDKKKLGRRIHGIPVLGPVNSVVNLAQKRMVDEILIAVPSAAAAEMRKMIEACEKTGLPFRTTPGINEIIDGEVSIHMAREVSFEDMLGRDQVVLDAESIAGYVEGKRVLVSGAAGSIGSELCRQLVTFRPDRLIALDKTENSLFHLEMEFKQRFPGVDFRAVLGDVRNKGLLDGLFEEIRPEVVFHAAAYKHVHIVELNPWEGVLNNVQGTRNIASAAFEHGAGSFVMVSTDKAVRPVGVMGATKRVAEMITSCYGREAAQNNGGRRFVSVRFGNVLGSEGSVLHLFKKQIGRLGPVTVTHPDITRYFMTIPEAARLILQAGSLGNGGEVFILEMGTPVKIADMARDLIRRSGYEPDVDIEIKYTGLRPGEKLHEELVAAGEEVIETPYGKIVVLKQNGCDPAALELGLCGLIRAAENRDAEGIRARLMEIVPEYRPSGRAGGAGQN